MGFCARRMVTRFATVILCGTGILGGVALSVSAKESQPQRLADKPVDSQDICGGDRPIELQKPQLRSIATVLQDELAELEQSFVIKGAKKTCQAELQKLVDDITNLYVKNGYINSKATITTTVPHQVLIAEGEIRPLAKEQIRGLKKVDPDYVLARLNPYITSPFNADKLQEGIEYLNRDPNFSSVRATIVAATPNESKRDNRREIEGEIQEDRGQAPTSSQPVQKTTAPSTKTIADDRPSIKIEAKERNQFQGFASFDNESPFALGSERYGAGVSISNMTNFGDRFTVANYRTTTGGLDQYDFTYSIPVNADDGLLSLRISPSNYRITQPDFNFLGIRGTNTLYEINFKQPVLRSRLDEFSVSLGYAYQSGQTFIFNDTNIPFGIGPDADGTTRTGVLKFSQDYIVRELNNSYWAFRSQLNLGTGFGVFNVSNNKADSANAPTGYFLSWNGLVQRVQALGRDVFLIGTIDTQLANDPLLSSQQFLIGGAQSVRGFRQNVRVGDNGIRFSLENRWIALRDETTEFAKLQFLPFVELGGVWNNPRNPNALPNQNFIAAGGLGAIFEPIKGLTLRLDYAIPFLQLPDKSTNLQDSSLYFKMNYQF